MVAQLTLPSYEMMGALYEDVENFFGDIFAWYGRLIARYAWCFVIIPVLVSGLLGLGLFLLKYETQVEVLYTPMDSQSVKDQALLQDSFTDRSADDYFPWQQTSLAIYGEVIVRKTAVQGQRKRTANQTVCQDDLLLDDVLREIRRLNVLVLNVTATDGDRTYGFEDICAMRDGTCVVEGLEILDVTPEVLRRRRTNRDRQRLRGTYGARANTTDVRSTLLSRNNQTCYDVLRLRYNLRHNDTEQKRLSLLWELQFISALQSFQSSLVVVVFTVSESLDIELRKHVDTDTRFLGFAVLGMIVFATVIGSGVNCVTNHVTLAYAGVFASLMAVLSALGLLSLVGVRYVYLCGVMPFLVLGIGADDMFQLLTEWRQSNIRDSIEERMASTMRSTAVSVTITSLTDIIALCIGATSPYVSIRNFCAFSGVAIFLCYVNQLTFYSGCIVLHARRVQASRHWITCCPTKSREELEEEGANAVRIVLCSGNPPRRVGEEGGICRKLSRVIYTHYPRFLLHWITKLVVFVLFIVYISLSLWGAVRIRKGLKLEEVVPNESYLSDYLRVNERYFPESGPTITFMIHGPHRFTNLPVLYHEKATLEDVNSLLKAAQDTPVIVDGSEISWLEQYTVYRQQKNMSVPHSEREFLEGLRGFFEEYPRYRHDVVLDSDESMITASRVYVRCQILADSAEEGEMMIHMRRIANSSPLSVIAYSPDFVYYEHYVSVVKNTFLPVGVTMLGLLFVALVFIPHPIAVVCVTISMVSIVIGMVGLLHFWDVSLAVVTVIQIIMSLGMCVSFTVHMSHGFMTATGKNRTERVTVAIEKVGIPILNGALSSFLCALMLVFGASFIFTSFFKTMLLVFFLGIMHSLVFLPVMLSFIGPRRTNKPRVFIPVSPSSRSLQDTYRANSLVPRTVSDTKLDRSPQEADYSLNNSRELGTINEAAAVQDDMQEGEGEEAAASSPDSTKGRKVSFNVGDSSPMVLSTESSRRTSAASTCERLLEKSDTEPDPPDTGQSPRQEANC